MDEDRETARETAFFPAADITPAEFESYVVELFTAVAPFAEDFTVTLHDKIIGPDGVYDFDATVRFTLGGMQFLVLVEAKRHRYPIKRELVQVLHAKLQSVGAHKAVMFSTAPYQRGALEYAKKHGIALVTVTEGRFTYETRSLDASPVLDRQTAMDRFGLPTFVAHAYRSGSSPRSTRVTLLSEARPSYVAEELLGVTIDA